MATEWWFYENGVNSLSGVDGDIDNPPVLTDDMIVEFLNLVPAARDSFYRIVPNMLPEEQERLYKLAVGIPQYNYQDPVIDSDAFQNRWNRAGIHTTGKKRRTKLLFSCLPQVIWVYDVVVSILKGKESKDIRKVEKMDEQLKELHEQTKIPVESLLRMFANDLSHKVGNNYGFCHRSENASVTDAEEKFLTACDNLCSEKLDCWIAFKDYEIKMTANTREELISKLGADPLAVMHLKAD